MSMDYNQVRLLQIMDQYDAQIRTMFESVGGNCDEDVMLVNKYEAADAFKAIVEIESQKSLPRVFFVNYLPEDQVAVIIKRKKLSEYEFLLSD